MKKLAFESIWCTFWFSTKNPWKTNVLVHVGLPMSLLSPVDPRISVMCLVWVNMKLTASRGMPKMCCCCCCCWIVSIKDSFWEKRHWFFPCHDKFHLSSCQILQCLDSFTYTSTYIYIYTLWWTNIAIENGPFLMGKLTISTGPFSIAMLVHQRVYI